MWYKGYWQILNMENQSHRETIRKLKQDWYRRCRELENHPISDDEIYLLKNQFESEYLTVLMSIPEHEYPDDMLLDIEAIRSELRKSCAIAKSKYNIMNKTFWARITVSLARIIHFRSN